MTCEQWGAEVDFYLEETAVQMTRTWLGWALAPWYMRGFFGGCAGFYLPL